MNHRSWTGKFLLVTSASFALAVYARKPGNIDIDFDNGMATSCCASVSATTLGWAVDGAHD
jgi:hypothetical protein